MNVKIMYVKKKKKKKKKRKKKKSYGVLKSRKSSYFARAMAARAKMLTKVVKFDRYFSEISSSGVTLISTNTQLGEIGFLLKCCQDLSPCSY